MSWRLLRSTWRKSCSGSSLKPALERAVPNSRMGRPYAPDQRISWMAELLPYLGQSGLYAQINPAHFVARSRECR